MKSDVWKPAVTRHALPELPGDWLVGSSTLVMAPVGHVAGAVVRNNSSFGTAYYLYVTVQPLYVEMDNWQGDLTLQLGHASGEGYWPGFDTPDDGAESMRTLARLVREEAVPYLARFTSPEGFLELCRRAAAEHPAAGKVYLLRQQAATELLLGDAAAATGTLATIRAAADATADPPRWLLDIAADADALRATVTADPDAGRRLLAETERRMRERLRLPAPP
jgi:hypothetical protein